MFLMGTSSLVTNISTVYYVHCSMFMEFYVSHGYEFFSNQHQYSVLCTLFNVHGILSIKNH